MIGTRYCIICGKAFEAPNPEVVICPDCGSLPAVPSPARDQEGAKPAQTPSQAANSTWQPGQVILDTYEVKGELGKGGFGRVYRVHHKSWNMDLAVKRALNLDEQGKQAFIDEAQKWIDLGLHPHIISCYYVRNIDGFPHTFAELAEGGSLESWIQRGKHDLYADDPQAVLVRILDIAIQFAWGLAYAHDQGLVHQDVKPGNALMTPDGILKVTDFGLARAKAGSVVGDVLVTSGGYTPAYCSPEQAAGMKLSLKTDIWSWAVSVLEMFNGGVSWMGGQVADSALESYLGRAGEEEDIPAMPDAVADLLWECFQEDPQARPKDMPEIADRLIRIYQQEMGQLYHREIPKPADLKADSLNNKALSMLDLGKPEQAEAFLEQAVGVDIQHVEATYNLGLLRWRSARTTDIDVLQKLQQIQQDKPGDSDLASALGWICLESGRFSEALAYFEQSDQLGGDLDSTDGIRLARPLAESRAGTCLRTFEGHTYIVESVAFCPDGHRALSGGGLTPKLWDLAGGACLRTFQGHNWTMNAVSSVTVSTDGRRALSANGKKLKLWDLARGRRLRTFTGHKENILSVAISPDGHWALSGSHDKTLKLWPLGRFKRRRTFEGHFFGSVYSVAFSPDGRWALSGSEDRTLKLWDLVTGKWVHTLKGHKDDVKSVAISPDGHYALSGSNDTTIKLWDLMTGKCLRTLKGHTSYVKSVAFSPDGRQVLSGSWDKTIRVWDRFTGVCLRTFEGHTSFVNSVDCSPDGQWALSGSHDKTLKLWDIGWVDKNRIQAPMRYARGVEGLEASRRDRIHKEYLEKAHASMIKGQIAEALVCLEGARSVVGFERARSTLALSARLAAKSKIRGFKEGWYTNTLKGQKDSIESIALSPDGRQALSTGSYDDITIKLWDLAGGSCLRTFKGHTKRVESVVISPDGYWGLSGSYDKTLKLWDLATGVCLRTFEGHRHWVNSVAISPDRRWALSGSGDCTLKLWDLVGGACLHTFERHDDWVLSVAISPDGRWALSGSGDHTLKLWDLAGGACQRTFEGHTEDVQSVALSPDARWALSGSADHTLKLWDLAGGTCLHTFEGHTGSVQSVAFSSDRRWALSGSKDKSLKLWDLVTGACLRTFEGHTAWVNSVAFSTDGHQVLSGSGDQMLKLWNLVWEYEFPGWANWDDGARPYLETFLTLHTPYAGELPQGREPNEEEIRLYLTRQGKPSWAEDDFQGLLTELSQRGYGWLRAEGVRKKLEEMAREMG